MYEYESDEFIVGRVLDGNTDEYAKIVGRYQEPLLRYVRRIVFDSEVAPDIVQNAFISAYTSLRSFNTKKKFSSWLYRIAHNEAVNYIRKNRRQFVPRKEQWWDNIADEKQPAADRLDGELKRRWLRQALAGLPLKYRSPLILHVYEKKSYQQISEILRLHPSTVGVRINRAKAILKKRLEEKA